MSNNQPKGTPEQRREYKALSDQAHGNVKRMNEILAEAGRTDYRMELRAIKTVPPMTIDDDDDYGDRDPTARDRRPYDEDRDGGELSEFRDRRYHRDEEDEYGH